MEQPFGIDPPNVHCPICGQATFTITSDSHNMTPCDHLALIYVGSVGEYVYQSPTFQERTASLGVPDQPFKEFPQYLNQAGYDNQLLLLEITYGGMACGPIWYTDIYGYDYSMIGKETAETA
ncbi:MULTISPECIES: hypothetical protein [Cyanophyceae]|uniref:hypothetical protein n=1 Tax=Cyanophyceae TaxID=3028117 RepID=UPI000A0EF402|nr:MULTISPECIES: hypothetical protein [Cyanophyceae]SMH58440.1 hypothetical protein SAMN06272755_3187 [Picosynechococcus sp. OG1]SMQ86435.1 hypothetical protein SAMN06272774_3179 [Synechococcus sp. 7002]